MNMARGKLIVLEGLDAAGKRTQANILLNRLIDKGMHAHYVHFPTYEATRFGELIARYLRGEFGPKEATPPEVGCLLYALDRYQFKSALEEKLAKGICVVADRYTYSNIYQAAKAKGSEEQEAVFEWLMAVESRMPKADLVIMFDAPPEFAFTQAGVRGAQAFKGRRRDIHEFDSAYMARVRSLYLKIAKRMKWPVVQPAKREAGQWVFRPKEEISEEVWAALRKAKIVRA